MTTDQNTNDPRFVFACALDGAGGSHPVATQTAEPRWYHLDYSQPDTREALSGLGLDTGLIDSLTASRYVEDLDLVRERAMVLQEELLNRNVEQQNARMYVLAILSAIFLPITFITGLFGMNVAGLPGTRDGHAFAIVVAIMAAALAVVVALMRRKHWF
ncbi:MAG: hypothetical protein IPH23_05385 [Gammaproteobacteria bacterium]|nr:hypothetical protein [Gammaproteobacteria bacterium]